MLTGDIVWADLGMGLGREQGGRRPMLVVSSNEYLALDTLVLAVPITSRDRGWPNHVLLSGPTQLDRASYAMTEQVRSISRDRVAGIAGSIDADCLDRVRTYLRDFLDLW